MKKNKGYLLFPIFLLMAWSCAGGEEARAACRNPYIAGDDDPFIRQVAASGRVEIKWFGHSFFQITSSTGTKIVTDPFGAMGFPMPPDVWADVVTVGREHGNHNNVGLPRGKPLILRGIKEGTDEWNQIEQTFRDVLIYNVPVHQRGVPGNMSLRGSAFVFEVDGLCILHSGDISDPYNEDQLQLIGHVDVLLQVIGGVFTIGPEGGRKIIEQLQPKVVIPMHYWYSMGVLERFIGAPYSARFLDTNSVTLSRDTLPPATEILILKVVREGDL